MLRRRMRSEQQILAEKVLLTPARVVTLVTLSRGGRTFDCSWVSPNPDTGGLWLGSVYLLIGAWRKSLFANAKALSQLRLTQGNWFGL